VTDRSVPFIGISAGTGLRFDRGDIEALETLLGCSYRLFTRPGVFGSLTATVAFVWRGLRVENAKGDLVHAFALTDAGRAQAGDLVWQYLQGHTPEDLDQALVDAFAASGLWKKKSDKQGEDESECEGETAPKNSQP